MEAMERQLVFLLQLHGLLGEAEDGDPGLLQLVQRGWVARMEWRLVESRQFMAMAVMFFAPCKTTWRCNMPKKWHMEYAKNNWHAFPTARHNQLRMLPAVAEDVPGFIAEKLL